jgi:hypothetical protein
MKDPVLSYEQLTDNISPIRIIAHIVLDLQYDINLTVGLFVDGIEVGILVGINDGNRVCTRVGINDGLKVGTLVGIFEGHEVGTLVWIFDGFDVGALVVGLRVGILLGAAIGNVVCSQTLQVPLQERLISSLVWQRLGFLFASPQTSIPFKSSHSWPQTLHHLGQTAQNNSMEQSIGEQSSSLSAHSSIAVVAVANNKIHTLHTKNLDNILTVRSRRI